VSDVFSDAQIAQFLRRSYFVVDGLWFVKAEEECGFDKAMALDEAVWDVMAKIQARKAKSMLGLNGGSLDDLAKGFRLKLEAEGYDFDTKVSNGCTEFEISVCPWYEILKSSGRTQIAREIAERICATEFAGWTREFSVGVDFQITGRLCVESDGCDKCRLVFSRRSG
jgi:hypothetical protein